MVNVWLTSVASIQGDDEERTISGRGWVTIKKDELSHIFVNIYFVFAQLLFWNKICESFRQIYGFIWAIDLLNIQQVCFSIQAMCRNKKLHSIAFKILSLKVAVGTGVTSCPYRDPVNQVKKKLWLI